MDSNHLKFNSQKTQLIVKTKGVNNMHGYLNLEMGGKVIEQEETVKVLGVVLGQDEKYKEYLVNGKNSMMKFLTTRHNMLKMLAKHADLKARKALAEGLILSKINYCISLWGTTTDTIMQKLHVFVNDVVRTVFGIGRNRFQHLKPLYKKLKWLTVRETLLYHDTITIHSMIKHQTPQDIAAKFNPQCNHSYNTRGSKSRFRPNPETTSINLVRDKAFVCRAARAYHNIPDLLTESIFLPYWAYKDWVRSDIGGWPIKERTEAVVDYLTYLRKTGHNY